MEQQDFDGCHLINDGEGGGSASTRDGASAAEDGNSRRVHGHSGLGRCYGAASMSLGSAHTRLAAAALWHRADEQLGGDSGLDLHRRWRWNGGTHISYPASKFGSSLIRLGSQEFPGGRAGAKA
jgi:hypothetical protein